MDASKTDAPTSACPTCGTPRGHYDRFCTVCGEDLGAPGAAMGVMIQGSALPGTSSGAARQRVTGPSERTLARAPSPGVARPGPVSGPRYAAVRALGAPVPADGRTFAQLNPSTYRGEAGDRIWRTLAIANRMIVLVSLAFFGLSVAVAIGQLGTQRGGPGALLLGFFLVGVLPAVLIWIAAGRLESGTPPILRPLALLEMLILIPLTYGLVFVPLVVAYLVAGQPDQA